MVSVKGNPMGVPIGLEGTLLVQCLPMGSLDLQEGEILMHFVFEPHSAGVSSWMPLIS